MVSPASSTSFETTGTSTTIATVDVSRIPRRKHQRKSESAPATTPTPTGHPGQYGIMACCDSAVSVCTLQPTACVDKHMHPASVLCTGSCLNDDMTLKCTAGMNWQCRLAQMATPIAYIEQPSYDDKKLRRRDESSQGRLATLDQVVRGWYCGPVGANNAVLSQSLEISTLGQVQSITSTTETRPTEAHSDHNHSMETPPPDPQPAPSIDHPSPTAAPSSVDIGQGPTGPPSNEDCEWIDDDGNCCDPSEWVYSRPHLGSDRDEEEVPKTTTPALQEGSGDGKTSTTTRSKAQVITYTHLTTLSSRPMTTFTPVEAPNMTIIEAVYIILSTYKNQTDPSPFREASGSFTISTYVDTLKTSSATAKPTRPPRPVRPTTSNGSDPKAGLKAGIAIGAIVVLVLVGLAVFYCRRVRKAKRTRLERDSQPGPTRGWST